ncbi:MAG TPA: response regulator transcription factor [Spirochaetota bacterium]|nr:response regulator transcription factor [Spirochaetota bacterium]
MKEIKIAILDDHPGIRLGISALLESEPNFKICGNFSKSKDLFDSLKNGAPDLVIIDINLDGENGLEIMKNVLSVNPSIKFLVYSMLDENIYAEKVLKNGGSGYIMKNEILENIVKAIKVVLNGNIFLSERISSNLINKGLKEEFAKDKFETLSIREHEILKMMGDGSSLDEISTMFNISISTINTYKKRISEKLNIKNFFELKKIAIKYRNNFLN